MEESKPVRKTSQLAWVLVFLGAAATAAEILSISTLGTNANNTFSRVGENVPHQKQPPRPPSPNP